MIIKPHCLSLTQLEHPGVSFLTRTVARMLGKPTGIFGVVVLMMLLFLAAFAPVIAPHDPLEIGVDVPLSAPSLTHPFGTDDLGRDLLSRVIYGSRISLFVSVVSALVAIFVAVPLGMLAGYFGGNVDALITRFFDTIFAFPAVLIGIALAAAFGAGLNIVVAAVAIINIPSLGRLARVAVLSHLDLDFVLAGRALGASEARVLTSHILPNIVSSLIVQTVVLMAGAVLLEAGFSFLGIGVRPPAPSWGTLLDNGRNFMAQAPWLGLFPGLAITLMVLGLNSLEEALRFALSPQSL